MRIKWKFSYYPYGGWVDENDNGVSLTGNFHATSEDTKIIVTMSGISTPPGHGEPAMTGVEPKFINAETLEEIKPGEYIEIDESILK